LKEPIPPKTIAIIVGIAVVLLAGFFIFRGSQSAGETKESAKRGEDVGKKMMQGMMGGRPQGAEGGR
jgi:hypothetical protein